MSSTKGPVFCHHLKDHPWQNKVLWNIVLFSEGPAHPGVSPHFSKSHQGKNSRLHTSGDTPGFYIHTFHNMNQS